MSDSLQERLLALQKEERNSRLQFTFHLSGEDFEALLFAKLLANRCLQYDKTHFGIIEARILAVVEKMVDEWRASDDGQRLQRLWAEILDRYYEEKG